MALLLVSLLLVGCKTTYSVVREESYNARFKVTSEPAGGTVYLDRSPRGNTPTYLDVPYKEVETEISPAKRKNGLALLITGVSGLAIGTGMLIGGIALSNDSDGPSGAGIGLATLGGIGALYGLIGGILGVVVVAVSQKPPNTIETKPSSLLLGVRLPGQDMSEARVAPINPEDKRPAFNQVKAVHYSGTTNRWTAPDLPASLKLVAAGQKGRRTARRTRRRTRPAGPRSQIIIAVFDIEDRGANLSRAMLGRLSDYLSMKIAATAAFQVIPRDKLKERLTQQKTSSYKQCYAQSCQIEVGKELAAQKSLSTMIVRLGSKCNVTSVLYDLRKAASEGGASEAGGCSEDGIVETLEKVVAKLNPR
jgi:hypothetical protein